MTRAAENSTPAPWAFRSIRWRWLASWRAAGFDPKQAQDTAAALAEVLSEQVATKHDINELRADLREVEQRLVIKLGGMIAVAVAVVAILVRLL